MSSPDPSSLLRQYVETILARKEPHEVEEGNKLYDRIVDLALALRALGDPGWKALESLLSHEDVHVRLSAALDTYPRDPERTMAILEHLATTEPPGLVRYNADGCLRQMREGTYKDPSEWK